MKPSSAGTSRWSSIPCHPVWPGDQHVRAKHGRRPDRWWLLVMKVVAISGPVGSGKSTLARHLIDQFGGLHVRTQDLMRSRAAAFGDTLPSERRALQNYGEILDKDTEGGWVAE